MKLISIFLLWNLVPTNEPSLPKFERARIINVITRNMSVEQSMRNKLSTNLQTTHLDIINESYMHNVPKNSETHFKVLVVTDLFKDKALIKRHRMVNEVLKEELNSGVHALSIIALTPDQWESRDKKIEPSPNCRGGFGK